MWAWLPSDVVIAVAERLEVGDYIRLRAVCTAWASAIEDSCRDTQLPLMLYARTGRVRVDADGGLSLFNYAECRSYRVPLPADIAASTADPSSPLIIGHKDGWLAFVLDDLDRQPVLLDPLSGAQLPLPSFRVLPLKHQHDRWRRLILPTTPSSSSSFVAFAIHGFPFCTDLAFASPGDDTWHPVSSYSGNDVRFDMQFLDVVFHKGRFYAVYESGEMLAFELGRSPSVVLAKNRYLTTDLGNSKSRVFLLSSPSGDLLQVRRLSIDRRQSIAVMKFDAEADGWVEAVDLGNYCIVLDAHQAMLLSAVPGLRRNCVYFACFDRNGCYNVAGVGVYEVGGGRTVNSIDHSFHRFVHSGYPLLWFRPR